MKLYKNSNSELLSNVDLNNLTSQLWSYLAGMVEGDGTIAVHNKDSMAKKPMIVIV